jgi:hypothetical protein
MITPLCDGLAGAAIADNEGIDFNDPFVYRG